MHTLVNDCVHIKCKSTKQLKKCQVRFFKWPNCSHWSFSKNAANLFHIILRVHTVIQKLSKKNKSVLWKWMYSWLTVGMKCWFPDVPEIIQSSSLLLFFFFSNCIILLNYCLKVSVMFCHINYIYKYSHWLSTGEKHVSFYLKRK